MYRISWPLYYAANGTQSHKINIRSTGPPIYSATAEYNPFTTLGRSSIDNRRTFSISLDTRGEIHYIYTSYNTPNSWRPSIRIGPKCVRCPALLQPQFKGCAVFVLTLKYITVMSTILESVQNNYRLYKQRPSIGIKLCSTSTLHLKLF